MATSAIIQLSDWHLTTDPTYFPNKHAHLVTAFRQISYKADWTLIVISGGIAFSGERKQYDRAQNGLEDFVAILSKRTGYKGVFVAPGNHDCNFEYSNPIRATLVQTIKKQGANVADEEYVRERCKPLDEYYNFENRLICAAGVNDYHLLRRYSIGGDGSTPEILIRSWNTAWLSSLNERQGGLHFPTHLVKDLVRPNNNALEISILHHLTIGLLSRFG